MINSYNAVYYNGQSAKPVNVILNFDSLGMKLISPESRTTVAFINYEDVTQIQSFGKRHILILKSMGLPQSIEVEGETFTQSYKTWHPGNKHLNDAHRYFNKFGKKGVFVAIGFLVGFVVFTYFVVIPITIKVTTVVFPREYEIEMGKSIYNEYMRTMDKDSVRTVFINDFYKSLKVDTDYPIHITVVKENQMNAFALPGGEIVVYTGILDSMKNYNELIGLLGHEIGHVQKRHSLQMIIKNLSNYILISLVFQDYSGTLAVVAENAATIEEMSYSRNAESESDEFGYATIMLNGGDPNYMTLMFERMLKEEKLSGAIPAFLSTHPKLEERVAEIKKKAATNKGHYTDNDDLQYKFAQVRDGVALN
jgi:Zn-dependent protease with chaperone function